MSGPAVGTVGPAYTLTWPSSYGYLPPKSTASIVGTLVVYSDIAQMEGLPSRLKGFNLLLLWLHGEISLSLLWSHCPRSSAFVLALPLHLGHPQESLPHPGKRERKQWLIRAHLLTQAREGEGYGSHNWDVRGVPLAAETSGNLQQPEVCCSLSPGSWPQIAGPLAVAGCTGSWEGVGSDLSLLTGPLVAAVAAVAVTPTSGVQDSRHSSHPALELV